MTSPYFSGPASCLIINLVTIHKPIYRLSKMRVCPGKGNMFHMETNLRQILECKVFFFLFETICKMFSSLSRKMHLERER